MIWPAVTVLLIVGTAFTDARARARAAKLPACAVCGGHLTCGQVRVHHACDPDWPTYGLLRKILEASA